MPVDFILSLMAGALAGGFIDGLSGCGTALSASSFRLQVLQSVAMVLVTSFVTWRCT